jgi:ferric-dicitrate binding protein FerR (iron transport regulator)
MKELERHDRIARLLAKRWEDALAPEEADELEEWKNASDHNRALHDKIISREFLVEKLESSERVDYVAGWLAVHARRDTRRRARLVRRAAVAAAIVLTLSLGLSRLFTTEEVVPLLATIAPGEVRAELLLPDGEIILLDKDMHVHEILPPPVPSDDVDATPVSEQAYHVLRTPRGGEYTVTLPDGTIVFLNAESEIRFPVVFSASERRVSFTGEAYFEVARDTSAPFLVDLAASVVEVLGTRFNVRAYGDEEETRTTLVEGAVKFYTPAQGILLRAGEQGVLDRHDRLQKREVDVEAYTSWKNGYFAFDRSRLEEVMRDIARWYKITVIFEDPSLKDISFSGIVRRYGDFDTIIKMLEMTGDTRFAIHGDTIRITK